MHPSDFHNDLLRLRYLIRISRRPPRHRYGSPALDNLTSDTCRPCYPDGSLVWLPLSTYQYYGLPYTDTRSATIIKFTRLLTVQPSKRPISLSFRNSRLLIAQTPLLRTTKAYGQLLGRDFNPLAKLLLLRTSDPIDDGDLATRLDCRHGATFQLRHQGFPPIQIMSQDRDNHHLNHQ